MHDLDRITWELDELAPEAALPASATDREMAVLDDTTRLLELSTHHELEALLDRVVRLAARRSGGDLPPPVRATVAGLTKAGLRGLGRTVLPVAGRSYRAWTRPGGGEQGATAAARVGARLGLPVESLSTEDQEYEIALAYVRFAHQAAHRAFRNARLAPPTVAVSRALASARRENLPAARTGLRRGTWRRRGHHIVVEGL